MANDFVIYNLTHLHDVQNIMNDYTSIRKRNTYDIVVNCKKIKLGYQHTYLRNVIPYAVKFVKHHNSYNMILDKLKCNVYLQSISFTRCLRTQCKHIYIPKNDIRIVKVNNAIFIHTKHLAHVVVQKKNCADKIWNPMV